MGLVQSRFLLLIALSFGLSGCGTIHYLLQASQGQFSLVNRARPLTDVIEDEKTPPRVRKMLAKVPSVKEFGETQGLKPTSNYEEYVQLDRDSVVYVVSACEKLKFNPKTWGFPIVGSFTYLGWYDEKDAREYAEELKEEGLEVDVRGASAYSTLGWFRDPILSSMIGNRESAFGYLVNTVIHESVHATFYINGQSYFNESLANFVANELTPIYFEKNAKSAMSSMKAYQASQVRGDKVRAKLHAAYQELNAIYESTKSDSEKTRLKKEIIDRLTKEIKPRRPINNAMLIQYKTYQTGQGDFKKVFDACKKSWDCFWERIRTIDDDSFAKSQDPDLKPILAKLAKTG